MLLPQTEFNNRIHKHRSTLNRYTIFTVYWMNTICLEIEEGECMVSYEWLSSEFQLLYIQNKWKIELHMHYFMPLVYFLKILKKIILLCTDYYIKLSHIKLSEIQLVIISLFKTELFALIWHLIFSRSFSSSYFNFLKHS